jgi:hypothetical protein
MHGLAGRLAPRRRVTQEVRVKIQCRSACFARKGQRVVHCLLTGSTFGVGTDTVCSYGDKSSRRHMAVQLQAMDGAKKAKPVRAREGRTGFWRRLHSFNIRLLPFPACSAMIDDQQWAPEELGQCLDEITNAAPPLARDVRCQRLREYLRRRGGLRWGDEFVQQSAPLLARHEDLVLRARCFALAGATVR